MASALLMLLPAAAAAYGLSQQQPPKKKQRASRKTQPNAQQTPQGKEQPQHLAGATYSANVRGIAPSDFRKGHAAESGAKRYLRSSYLRNDGPAAQPHLATMASMDGKAVYAPGLYNQEPRTLRKVGTHRNHAGKTLEHYENKPPEPTGTRAYFTNTGGRNNMNSLLGEADLAKRKTKTAQNFFAKNDAMRTDIMSFDPRAQQKKRAIMDVQNNMNGALPSNSNQVTDAPFGMAMEGGHFMLRPKPRLEASMRAEASQQERENPRKGQGNRETGGATLRGKVRATANKSMGGRSGNKSSDLGGQRIVGAMTHCRDGTAKMKVNPLVNIDVRNATPYASMDDVKFSTKRGLKGANKIQNRGEEFGAKTRATKSVTRCNRTQRRKAPTTTLGDVGASEAGEFTKVTTKRGMKKYRKEMEEALEAGISMRAANPCLKNRTKAGPAAVANRDVLSQGQSAVAKHCVQRKNAGDALRMQNGGTRGDGISSATEVGSPEQMRDVTMKNRAQPGSFVTKTDKTTTRNPLFRAADEPLPSLPIVRNDNLLTTDRLAAASTSRVEEYQ